MLRNAERIVKLILKTSAENKSLIFTNQVNVPSNELHIKSN